MKTIIKNSKKMKPSRMTFLTVILTLMVSMVINSCKKDEETPIQTPNPENNTQIVKTGTNTNGSELYYGHEIFTRTTGSPNTFTRQIENPLFTYFTNEFVLKICNGSGPNNRVSSAVIKIDGVQIVGPSDFSQNVDSIFRLIPNLTSNSTLEVELRGKPGGILDIWIDAFLAVGSFIVTPAGGTFSIQDENSSLNGFNMVIPSNIFSCDQYISVNEIDSPDYNNDIFIKAGPAIEILTSAPNSTFLENITVTIPLTNSVNNFPVIGYFNDELQDWEIISPDTTSINSLKLSFQTNHFSVFVPFFFNYGLNAILQTIYSDFSNAREFLESGSTNPLEGAMIIDELKAIEIAAWEDMDILIDQYNACRDITSCTMLFGDLWETMRAEASAQGIQWLLERVVLYGAEAAAIQVVKLAFLGGNIFTMILEIDCISCFIPNSIFGHDFFEYKYKILTAQRLIELINERIEFDNMLYIAYQDITTLITPNVPGSHYMEISMWQNAGFNVTTMSTMPPASVTITPELLEPYEVLRLVNYYPKNYTVAEGNTIYNWVNNGGKLLADINNNADVNAVSNFGVDYIEGAGGGNSGLTWFYHGAPLYIGPVTGPFSSGVTSIGIEAMDRPHLKPNHQLNIAASYAGYPAVVYRTVGSGKVVITFDGGSYSLDVVHPGNAYRSCISYASNHQFVQNIINYFEP